MAIQAGCRCGARAQATYKMKPRYPAPSSSLNPGSLACLLVLWLLMPAAVWANCSQVFPGGVQNHSPGGSIRLQPRALITGSGTQLHSNAVSAPGGFNSCGTATCSANSNPTAPVTLAIQPTTGVNGNIQGQGGSFPAGNYATVSLNNDATLTFTSPGGDYRFGNFNVLDRGTIRFAPGDYWINGNLNLSNDVRFLPNGSGPVRIFVSGTISTGDRFQTDSFASADLLLFAKGNITAGNEARISGFIYSETGNVTVGHRGLINGGISAAANIELDNDSRLNYSATAAEDADFGALCGTVSAPAFSHWQIDTGGGSASTCAPFIITLSARDASNNVIPEHVGEVQLTTSTNRGNWSKTSTAGDALGPLTPGPANSGAAMYNFAPDGDDQGQITLQLANSQAQTLTVQAIDSAAGITTLSAPVAFAENAFVIISIDAHADDLIAGRPHALQAQMLRRDPTTGACGPAPEYQNNQVQVWLTRTTADPGGAAPLLTSDSAGTTPPDSAPGGNNFVLPFSAGVANFSLLASDVGQYAINIRDNNVNFSDIPIVGGSATLVARPFGFAMEVLDNPGATTALGTVFRAAGDVFSVQVSAVGWQAADDTNNDGLPDGHQDQNPNNDANLNNNPVLVNFGREAPSAGVRLNARLLSPAGGLDPGLANGDNSGMDRRLLTAFTNGTAATDQVFFPEVGIAQITAELVTEDYLGVGSIRAMRANSTSGPVGRFTPAYFEIEPIELTPGCSQMLPFSYMEQPFTIAWHLTAYNRHGNRTGNYDGDYARLAPEQHINLRAIDRIQPTPLSSRISHVSQLTWDEGMATVDSEARLARDDDPDGPFEQVELGARVTDADGITTRVADLDLDSEDDNSPDAVQLGQSDLRFGRLRLTDAFGPETADLPVTMQSEYWRDGDWLVNRDDECTTLALSSITYNDQSLADNSNRTVTIGAGTTTGQYADIDPMRVRLQSGSAGHYFTAPGAGNTGSLVIDVNLTDYPWLRFDWNADGDQSDPSLPPATITFGTYRGHDRVIYWREILR